MANLGVPNQLNAGGNQNAVGYRPVADLLSDLNVSQSVVGGATAPGQGNGIKKKAAYAILGCSIALVLMLSIIFLAVGSGENRRLQAVIDNLTSEMMNFQQKYNAMTSEMANFQQKFNAMTSEMTNFQQKYNAMTSGASSCKELNKVYGLTTNGYYPLRQNDRSRPIFFHCDFNKYYAASSCKDLNETNGNTTNGYYLFRKDDQFYFSFFYCDFNVYEDISNCSELRERGQLVTGTGFYFIRSQLTDSREIVCTTDIDGEFVYATCLELKEFGVSMAGFYTLRSPTHGAYEVFCNFTEGRVITQVAQQNKNETEHVSSSQRCRARDCYSWYPRYPLSWNQLTEIAKKSRECRQYIKAICVNQTGGYSSWISRGGRSMHYWGGATSMRSGYCACGEAGTCVNNSHKCNCGSSKENETVDEGYLTDKTKLPVRKLNFTSPYQTSGFIRYTLGALECWGKEFRYTTCYELYERGIVDSGFYTLRPTTSQSYRVYCNFTNGTAITQVPHEDMQEIKYPVSPSQRCYGQGCYTWEPRYLLSWSQITEIVSKSEECQQYIRARCVNSEFLGRGYAGWVSRDYGSMRYWGGATLRKSYYCSCGETDTCMDRSYKCNCDSNNANEAIDEGYLTDKTKLPVRQLRLRSSYASNGFIWHTLGALECWGKKFLHTCHELQKHEGVMKSGFYTLHGKRSGEFQVYCNFTDGRAITKVLHQDMHEIKHPVTYSERCYSQGCYSWRPRYSLTWDQMYDVTSKSEQCQQYIKARCVNVRFLGLKYAWWVSKGGSRMNYWGGATSKRNGYCACGESGTCVKSGYKCNCDANSATEAVDEGYLTEKSKLPVKELRLGDLDVSDEFIWLTLGALECWGVPVQPTSVRLAGTYSTSSKGRVEVYKNGLWGTVCDDGWDINDGNVVCSQLGFTRATRVTTGSSIFGRGSGYIFMDDVACTGRESHILDCSHVTEESEDCSHSEDAGVYCE